MRVALVLILAMFLRLPFLGGPQSLCVADDHLAVNCHDTTDTPHDTPEPIAHTGTCTDTVTDADHPCVDLIVDQQEAAPARTDTGAIVVPALLPLVTLALVNPSADEACALNGLDDGPPQPFSALRHARTVVIRF